MADQYDVIVVGGGAAGMMAAVRAAERGRRVLLLEKNKQLGKKLAMTGGGRCNIMNAEEDIHRLLDHYGEAAKFLYSPFAQFGVSETHDFFERHGLPLVTQAHLRVFPKTERAVDVVKLFEKLLQTSGVEVRTGVTVRRILWSKKSITGVEIEGEVLTAESYIVATGGVSHPETGSTGDGFHWLQNSGHDVRQPTPTIVPLAVADAWVTSLAGITLSDVKITFFLNGKKELKLRGRILLTHFGLSGPLILNAAGDVADLLHDGEVTAMIDTHPDRDLGALDRYLTETFDANKNKELKNVMKVIAPTGTADAVLSLVPSIDPATKVHSITKAQRKMLVDLLKALPVHITGLMGYDRAVVADGGVALTGIDPKTMRSRQYPNLYLTGDLLDISRPSGGYSLQLCWTSGWVAGSNA